VTDEASVLIHVRSAPDGGVTEIGERPDALTPQAWFNALSRNAGGLYQPLQGGRGVFRLRRDDLIQFQQ
jgi:hypothetical protein